MHVKKCLLLSGLLWAGIALAWKPLFLEQPQPQSKPPVIIAQTKLDDLHVNSPAATAPESFVLKDRLAFSGQLEGAYAWSQLEDKSNGTYADDCEVHLTTANLFMQLKASDNISARVNFHFGNNDFYHDLYQTSAKGGAGVAIASSREYKTYTGEVDEAFVTWDHIFSTPLFIRAGRMYAEIGDYKDPYTPMPSLHQVMTQTNHALVDVSWVTEDGFYGAAFVYRGNLENESNGFYEWGGKFGFHSEFDGITYDVNGGILRDPRTMFESSVNDNPGLKRYFLDRLNNASTFANQNHMFTAHAEADTERFSSSFDFVKVTGGFTSTHDTQPMVFTVNAALRFNVFNHDWDIHGRGEAMTNGDNVVAFDEAYQGGINYYYNKHTRFSAEGAYYKGSNGSNGQFNGEPGELLIALAGIRVDV